jgi:hypothetical protein
VDEVLPRMVQKTLKFACIFKPSIAIVSYSFDLWMFKGQLQCGCFCPSDKFLIES